MLQYMLDTNICIYVMKRYPAKLEPRFNALAERLCISTITLCELHYGIEKSARPAENLRAVDVFAARLEVLPFPAKATVHYGQIRARLDRLGRPVGQFDMLIAAHARSEGFTLVTNNLREFKRIDGLQVENWV